MLYYEIKKLKYLNTVKTFEFSSRKKIYFILIRYKFIYSFLNSNRCRLLFSSFKK